MSSFIVTIDGPAGAGKSSAARGLAKRLGFRFLDTGAMYRAVALAGMRRGIDWNDRDALIQLADGLSIRLVGDRVFLGEEDVTGAIRTVEVTRASRYSADLPAIRARLVELQRAAAKGASVVAEGRDQGTVVFPGAQCKIFLTASPEVRARRRYEDLKMRGQELPLERVLAEQEERDERDRSRLVGPLVKAADAIEISTDGMSAEEVIDRLTELVRSRMK
jgi:cytidylate kinase